MKARNLFSPSALATKNNNDIGAPSIHWHALAEPELMEKLEASRQGLGDAQVSERQREFGPNTLPAKKPPTVAVIFLHQFLSPLIYILLAAGVVAIVMGDVSDAGFIFGVVLLNATLGAFQEWKAEKSAASLQQFLKTVARVRRNGSAEEVGADGLVPGDWVYLESGGRVPADLRILESNNLAIDEALLTGESAAAQKRTEPLAEDLPVSDRHNMAFAGSIVSTGRGAGVVVATGTKTEVGKIAKNVTSTQTTKPPLVIHMERFARQVSFAVLLACFILGAVALNRGMPVIDVFFLAVALAVSAIPEGLPVAMTVALSLATSRMAKRHVIVRRLTAVEGLGSCTFIASDKTGTLTLNKQTVQSVWLPSDGFLSANAEGVGTNPRLVQLCRLSMICSEASARLEGERWRFGGDAVDVAFWDLALRLGVDIDSIVTLEKAGEIPFESERAYSAAFFLEAGVLHVAVKGAPEVVLARCRNAVGWNGSEVLDVSAVEKEVAALTASGHRVMAIAHGVVPFPPSDRPLDERDLPSLIFVGLTGLIDPPRTEVRSSVEKCRNAGIEVAMVTGDHPLTALAIAREVGIQATEAQVVTGRQLAAIGSPDVPLFLDTVKPARVFARVSPMQKLQIVDSLVKLGHFVAVTGDGVNDAPALKRAHIGVAMGSGTDVTKETASIIVTDDNFASIEAGVEEGRFAYDNIRKVTYLLISQGFAEVVLFTLALLTGMPLPLLPVQLLWLNLATNGIQSVALAFEDGEPGAMNRKPRPPSEGIFNRLMLQQTLVSGTTIALVAYANFFVLLNYLNLTEFEARSRLLLLLVLLENFHLFNCRSEYVSAFRVPLRRNWMLVWGVLAAQGIHLIAMFFPPAQKVLKIAPVSLHEWLIPFAIASLILVVMEAFKAIKHGRRVAWPPYGQAERA